MKRICLIALLLTACAVVGCQEPSGPVALQASQNRSQIAPSADASSTPEEENTDELGYWERITTLYQSAKESGETSAETAGDWIGEIYDTAKSAGETAANDSTKWVTELYEQARETGETSAGSAQDWVMDDIQQIGTWQYKTLEIDQAGRADIVARLNELGAERWECFWVDQQGDSTTFYLKKAGRSYLRHLPTKELIRLLPLLGGDSDTTE